MSTYTTPLAEAIDLLRSGYSLPFSLKRSLIAEGHDPLALAAAHTNQKP